MISLRPCFTLILILFGFVLASDSSDIESIGSASDNSFNSDDEEPFLLPTHSLIETRGLVRNILNSTCQFEKAFDSINVREEFLENVCIYLIRHNQNDPRNLSVGKIISSYNMKKCSSTSQVLSCLFDFIDRQPELTILDFSPDMDARKALTLKVLRLEAANSFFWRQYAKTYRIRRGELFDFVKRIPGVAENYIKKLKVWDEEEFIAGMCTILIISLPIFDYIFMISKRIYINDQHFALFLTGVFSFGYIYILNAFAYKHFIFGRLSALLDPFKKHYPFENDDNNSSINNIGLPYQLPQACDTVRLTSQYEAEIRSTISQLFKHDIQFLKTLHTPFMREDFISNIVQSLMQTENLNTYEFNRGLLINFFNLKKCNNSNDLVSSVLEYVDRLPKFESTSYSGESDSLMKFATLFVRAHIKNNRFWEKYCELKKLNRNFLPRHVKTNFILDPESLRTFYYYYFLSYGCNFVLSLFPTIFIHLFMSSYIIPALMTHHRLSSMLFIMIMIITRWISFSMFLFERFERMIFDQI